MKSFCSVIETVKRMKIQASDWEKIYINHIANKILVSRMSGPSKLIRGKNQNNPM